MRVSIVQRTGRSVLVEYQQNGPHRVVVPAEAVNDNEVEDTELELGIPYGLPWEEMPIQQVTPELLAANLRRRGIWTEEDLQRRPNVALAAIMETCGVTLGALRRAVDKLGKEL